MSITLSPPTAKSRAITQDDIDRALRAANRPPAGKTRFLKHTAGQELVVSSQGAGLWYYLYRPHGLDAKTGKRHPQRRYNIGSTDTHGLSEARKIAAALRQRVLNGGDPLLDDRRVQDRARAAEAAAELEAKLAAAAQVGCRDKLREYEVVLAGRGTAEAHRRLQCADLRLSLDSIGLLDTAPGDLSPGHIEAIMSKCPAGSRSRRFATLHRFLTWALRSSDAMAPTLRFEKHERPKAPPSRQRFLDANEIRAIWDAAGKQRHPLLQDLVRFLVAVPCREGEASGMCWRDIGIDPTTGEPCWIMPNSKNGTPHRFHLPARAVALIAARRAAAGKDATGDALVFASPLSGKRFVSWSPLKRSLDLALGLPRPSAKAPKAPSAGRAKPRETPTKTASTSSPLVGQWRFHDLRRSCVTTLGNQNFDADTLDVLINHRAARTRGGITGVYNLSVKWNERVTAMRAYDHWLDTALGESTQGAEGPRARHGNVIALPAAGFRRIAGP